MRYRTAPLALCGLIVAAACAPTPLTAQPGKAAPARLRLQWKHADGLVLNEYSGRWVEKQKAGQFTFTEKARTADHVELYDKSRDYTVRLTATAMLIKGGKGTLPKFADFTKIRDGGWAADFPPIELGKLSEKYESGGRGPGTVSSGVGDPGGVSYGTYQLASKIGRADAFVKKYYPREFAGLKGGTKAFSDRWRELARKDPAGLHANEHAFIKETHHDVQAAKLAKELKLDVGSRSRVFQDVVWSVAVQHGPSTSLIVNALKPVLKGKAAAQVSDAELVRAVYAERSRKNASGKLVYASKLDDKWTKSLVNRFASERKDALTALDTK